MLISGGQVVAIDKVKHDTTLSGDGRFIDLGVNTSLLLTKSEADRIYQEKGNYALRSDLAPFITKSEANDKFAKIANVYSKTEIDTYFQPKGNYATVASVQAVQNDLNLFKTEVPTKYLTKIDAASLYITRSDLTNQYTQITNETDDKLQIMRDEEADLRQLTESHVYDETKHLNEASYNFLNALSGIGIEHIVNTTDLDSMPVDTLYGIHNIGPGLWEWQAIAGGSQGIAGINADRPLNAVRQDDTYHIYMDVSAVTVIDQAKALVENTNVGASGIFIDSPQPRVTRFYSDRTKILFVDDAPAETAVNEVYMMTMTADLLV